MSFSTKNLSDNTDAASDSSPDVRVGAVNFRAETRQTTNSGFFGTLRSRRGHDLLVAALFLTPSTLVFCVFVYYALAYNLYLSTTSWNFISPSKTFVGLGNYAQMFTDYRFWRVFGNTIYYAVGHVVASMVLGLGLALLLNQKIPARGLLRTLFYVPNVTTTAAVALLWVWIFNPRFGLVNIVLAFFGIEGPHWLLDPTWSMPAVIIFSTWRSVGYVMLIYLGGLLTISADLYEAAAIDGAGKRQVLFNITMPLLSPTTFFLFVTSFIVSLQVFDAIAVMTQGGPVGATKVLNYYIWEKAFMEFEAGYAAAVAVVLFVMILAVTLLQNVMSKRWVHYTE